MTRDDIIRMAKKAGLEVYSILEKQQVDWDCLIDDLQEFAALVAAAEREECAKVVGRYFTTARFDSRHLCLGDIRLTIGDQEEIDAAIRARGET